MTLENTYNQQSFSREQIEMGLHLDLIHYLISYNINRDNHENYYDIHITTDGESTMVEWTTIEFDNHGDCGKFEFVNYDEVVLKERYLPDNSTVFVRDEEEYQEQLDEFLKENPTYKQNEWGRWYDSRQVVNFWKDNKKEYDELVANKKLTPIEGVDSEEDEDDEENREDE